MEPILYMKDYFIIISILNTLQQEYLYKILTTYISTIQLQ